VRYNRLIELRYSSEAAVSKRERVRRELLQGSPHLGGGDISRIYQSDLASLFDLYDKIFFHSYFHEHFLGQLFFSLSTRMVKNAGKTLCPRNLKELSPAEERYELRISAILLFNYGILERDKVVSGIRTRDSLEALQLVFEHELCHLIELHCYKESSCRRARFQSLAFNIFGHTGSTHQLPVAAEVGREKYGLSVGDWVTFQHDGGKLSGIISRITRRATVMVPDDGGVYQDQGGRRYSKYYVPLQLLRRR